MSAPALKIEVGRVDDFPEGKATLVNVEGREIGVIRASQTRFYAVRNLCPHKGGPVCIGRIGGTWLPVDHGTLDWGLDDRVLQCPWHGWEFDLDSGNTLFGVSDIRLQTYPVSISDDRVILTMKSRSAELID
jgi:nitrite reductase (NADH) small subunit